VGGVRLRAVREPDLGLLTENHSREKDPFNFFGIIASNKLQESFAANGMISEDRGWLAVESGDGALIGSVSWLAVSHGPSPACRALHIGIALFPAYRGRGYGTAAQQMLAGYLFATTLVERLEAATDVGNIAERRALENAGFSREGLLRHAQFRDGKWRDLVLYSRLREDPGRA
jgi:RimJ/RimL family protein N-acetyltransferase